MNHHHQASPYPNFFQQHQDVTPANVFHHVTTAAAAAASASVAGAQPNMANSVVFGQRSLDGFYQHHNHQQNQCVPLAYHQASEAAAVGPNQLLWSHHQPQHRYVLPSVVPTAGRHLAASAPFAAGPYPMPITGMEHLPSMKHQHQPIQSHFRHQSPSTAPLYSIFSNQPQQLMADAYFNADAPTRSSPSNLMGTTSPLAGLRALSEHYNYVGGHSGPKSPSKSLSSLSANSDYQQHHMGRDPAKAAPNIASIASPPTANRGPVANSPQQSNAFIPPSPVLKSSQAQHSSPMSSSNTHSSTAGSGSFLVNSPATPRGRSLSSAGSVDAHVDSVVASTSTCGMMEGGSAIVGNSFSIPTAPLIHHSQPYEDNLTHSSGMAFYAQGIDPTAALMDPTTAALFGAQVVGSDPSLHPAVDDALSLLGRDVNLSDLPDISCANMMVGHNFWDDLGDAVLDDPLLGSHGATVCSASNSVDLVSNTNLSTSGTGPGVVLHSVLEFGTLGSSNESENGHSATDDDTSYRFQEDNSTKKEIAVHDLATIASNTTNATATGAPHGLQGDVTVATPKLREKMKRKAQGENELAEIDRAFARHLSMVAEKDEGQVLTQIRVDDTRRCEIEDESLSVLTADACLLNRLQTKLPKADTTPARSESTSPVHFSHATPAGRAGDAEMEELKKAIRKVVFLKKHLREASRTEPSTKKTMSVSDSKSNASSSTIGKISKQPTKIPIYKQTSVSTEKIPEQRRNSGAGGGGNGNDDSPYNFTDDEEEKEKLGAVKDRTDAAAAAAASAASDDSNSAPMNNAKQKMLDAEVTKKLLQISSLHPELKLSAVSGESEKQLEENSWRHVVPKKRQHWYVGGSGGVGPMKGQNSRCRFAENMVTLGDTKFPSKRTLASSASMFVKTEIMADDMSTAMPSTARAIVFNQTSSMMTDRKGGTPENVATSPNGNDKVLLPKLIIRIPKRCLEQRSQPSSALAAAVTSNGLNNDHGDCGQEDQHNRHHYHKKKKKEKRHRHESEHDDGHDADDAGKKRKHKKHKSHDADAYDDGGIGCTKQIPAGNETRRSISENEGSDQDRAVGNLIGNAIAARNEKEEAGSNRQEWDHLPFKLRKKLRCIPSPATEEITTVEGSKSADFNFTSLPGSSNEAYSRALPDLEEQSAALESDNKNLTLLRLRFLAGPVFQKGAFVVCKNDIGKPECPLWKVDSQNLLQKFSQTERQGRLVYVSTSTFAGWCLQNQDLYAPVQVRYVTQGRSECVVELESSLEEIFPAVSTEITDECQRNGADVIARLSGSSSLVSSSADCSFGLVEHPQTDALVAYVKVLLLHALLGNCLQNLKSSRSNNSGDWVSRIEEIDLVNSKKCQSLLACVNWQLSFKESVEWYSHCTVSDDESFGLQCQACGSAAVCNVLQLFANEGYDFDTLEARPPRTTASGSPRPSQDYHLCSSCATVAVRYHKLFHTRYHLFRKCEDAIELVRDGNPTLAAGAVVDVCMQNKKWLSTTLNEYLQLWSTVC